jgi:hypothetical protein
MNECDQGVGLAATERCAKAKDRRYFARSPAQPRAHIREQALKTSCRIRVTKKSAGVRYSSEAVPLITWARSAAKSDFPMSPLMTSFRGSHKSKMVFKCAPPDHIA